jgi:hypothetical protein
MNVMNDAMSVALRAGAIIADPAAAWAGIEEDGADPAYVMTRYVAPFALIPAVCGFAGACLIGVVVPGIGTVRAPIGPAILGAIFNYFAAFAIVISVGFLIDLIAPRFGGRRDFGRAVKVAVYAFTPMWLCGVFLLLPGLRFLELAGLYGAYLLVKGLPVLMKSPAQPSQSFAAATVIFATALVLLAAAVQHALFGTNGI